MKKKIKETEYRDSYTSRERRWSVLKLTEEERALVPSYPFTEEDLINIKKKAKKETRESLHIPWGVILIALGVALVCVLTIALVPYSIEYQNWLLEQDGRSIPFYGFLLCIPIIIPGAGLIAYGILWLIALGTAWLFFYYLNIYRPGGQFHRMKKEIQEDLKTELAANRLFAERKARTAPFAGDTQSQVLLNNHDALVNPSGARTLTHKI